MRIVLWDIDGTLLLNSATAGASTTTRSGRSRCAPAPGEPHAVEHGKTDGQILSERLERWGGDPALFDAVSRRMDELSDAYLTDAARRRAAPGVDAALHAVAAAGWTNGLLTGNSPHRARVKLQGAGIDVDAFDWDRSWFGDHHLRRSDLTAAARAELGGRRDRRDPRRHTRGRRGGRCGRLPVPRRRHRRVRGGGAAGHLRGRRRARPGRGPARAARSAGCSPKVIRGLSAPGGVRRPQAPSATTAGTLEVRAGRGGSGR